ncbi:MAG: signal peptidase II [Oscillospiraceae bacterium]|jgi:signal peptidase II|nr:signal peptidase II [Oscillospiraceae bacterium]
MYYSYVILAVLLILGDQLTKLAVRTGIPLGGSVPFIPHVLDLTYVQNTGAAFSILRTHTWLLTLISAAVVLAMCALIIKGFFKNALGRWAAALVLAGGMGNLIDRVVFGFVTDMFKTTFMDFAVFNVADCCITVGVPLLFLYVWFYVGRDEKKEGETDDAAQLPPDGP